MSRDVTDELIVELTRDLRAVQPIRPLRREAVAVAAVALGVAIAVVAGRGLRPAFEQTPGTIPFTLMALGLAVAGCGAVTGALLLGRPGRERTAWAAAAASGLALLACAGASAFLLWRTPGMRDPLWGGTQEIACVIFSLTLALPPALLVTYKVASAVPIHRVYTAVLSAAGATAFGMLSAHLTCRTPGAWHIVLTHAVAPLIGGLLLAIPLFILLDHWRRKAA